MTLDLCAGTRAWITRSASRRELLDFTDWLEARHYHSYVCDQHLRRLAFMLERLSPDGRVRTYSDGQLERAYARECSPRSRLWRFAASRRMYRRFLLAQGRLVPERDRDRFAALREDYDRYLTDLRGFAASTRGHHAQEVMDQLTRTLRPRQPLRSLRRADIERHIQARSREVSRHSLTHVVGILRGSCITCTSPGVSRFHSTPWMRPRRIEANNR